MLHYISSAIKALVLWFIALEASCPCSLTLVVLQGTESLECIVLPFNPVLNVNCDDNHFSTSDVGKCVNYFFFYRGITAALLCVRTVRSGLLLE